MRANLFNLFILFFQVNILHADNIGFSYLGVCHKNWPCKEGLKAYEGKEKLHLSFLYDATFGDDCPCIREMYQDPRDKITRIHLTNGPGLRNKRLQKEEVFYGLTIDEAENKILEENQALKDKFTSIAKRVSEDFKYVVGYNTIYVSTCLECDFNKEARKKLIEWTTPYFPNATFVDNPLNDSCIKDLVCEKHGVFPTLSSPCIVDLDGAEFDPSVHKARKDKFKNCIANYLWLPQFNLNSSLRSEFIPPRMRTAIPSEIDFNLIKNESN